ncbi:hypothetical protein ANOBCDAF_03341 [Pleomorphomonas sp. T1.2MG-36]|nr:hypothetical protein ANOBCDAF_03341 [Pleomorphomonas sp. T1.2MG-36]
MRAGMEIVGAIDSWDAAIEIYRRNIGDHVRHADIRDVVAVAPMVMDLRPILITGGPPCQDFSTAGLRVEGERAELMTAFAMTVAVVRPQWCLMENVARAQKSLTWARSREILKRAGYGITEIVVDASWYGVAQTRKRLIVVGRRDEADGFLAAEIDAARQARQTTIRDILGEDIGGQIDIHPSRYGCTADWPTDVPGRAPRTASQSSGVSDQQYIFVRPFGGGRGVRSIDEPAPALVRTSREPPAPGYLLNPSRLDLVPVSQVPHLSQQQTSLLQGFPKDWDWSPARRVRDIDQMIANAVPVALAEAIGRVILARHRGESVPATADGFSDWLKAQGVGGQVLRNRRHALGRARRLLGGRLYADIGEELRALEEANGFADLSPSTRSDLRAALRMHADWKASKKEEPVRRKAPRGHHRQV